MSNKEPNSHLNVFFAYRADKHENQLTRGLLVLFRLSRNIFTSYYEYLIVEANKIESNAKQYILPPSSDIATDALFIDTQTSNIGQIGKFVLMVGITAESEKKDDDTVNEASRGRIYDGVISVDNRFSITIETKLCDNVRDKQQFNHNLLKKHGDYIRKDIVPLRKPVILEWSKIIKRLRSLIQGNNLSDFEVNLIQDFLELVDVHHPTLNPFDSFLVCRNNRELLKKRIRNIAREIVSISVNPKFPVKYHTGYAWGIKTKMIEKGVQQIDFPIEPLVGDDWEVKVSIQFGVGYEYLRLFYENSKGFQQIQAFCTKHQWELSATLHIGFANENNAHIDDITPVGDFYDYWKKYPPKRITPKKKIISIIEELRSNHFVFDLDKAKDEIRNKYMGTGHKSINMRPTIAIDKRYSKNDLVALDEQPNAVSVLFYKDIKLALEEIIGFKF